MSSAGRLNKRGGKTERVPASSCLSSPSDAERDGYFPLEAAHCPRELNRGRDVARLINRQARRAMGKVTFEFDDDPFEMVPEGTPEAVSEGQSVVVTIAVYVPGEPQRVALVRVPFTIQAANLLIGRLEDALVKARRPAKE